MDAMRQKLLEVRQANVSIRNQLASSKSDAQLYRGLVVRLRDKIKFMIGFRRRLETGKFYNVADERRVARDWVDEIVVTSDLATQLLQSRHSPAVPGKRLQWYTAISFISDIALSPYPYIYDHNRWIIRLITRDKDGKVFPYYTRNYPTIVDKNSLPHMSVGRNKVFIEKEYFRWRTHAEKWLAEYMETAFPPFDVAQIASTLLMDPDSDPLDPLFVVFVLRAKFIESGHSFDCGVSKDYYAIPWMGLTMDPKTGTMFEFIRINCIEI